MLLPGRSARIRWKSWINACTAGQDISGNSPPGPGRGEGGFGYAGVVHGLRQAARSEGVLSLWKGLAPRLLIKGLGSTIWYTAYMEARRVFALAAGSTSSEGSRGYAARPADAPLVGPKGRRKSTCLDV